MNDNLQPTSIELELLNLYSASLTLQSLADRFSFSVDPQTLTRDENKETQTLTGDENKETREKHMKNVGVSYYGTRENIWEYLINFLLGVDLIGWFTNQNPPIFIGKASIE